MKKIQILITALSVLLFSSQAFAGGFITPNTTQSIDTRSINDNGTVNGSFESGLSYCCNFYAQATSQFVTSVSTSVTVVDNTGSNTGTITAVDRQATSPVMGVVNSPATTATANRLCFMPTATSTHRFLITDISNDGTNVNIECNETTLFGGYNTNANPFNFLEISNLTNQTITGKIFATNFDGTTVINGSSFSVDANKRIDVSIHDSAGSNVFGIIKIVHDGPLGALQANTSFYSGPVSALELKGTVPAKVRDRR